MTEQEKDHTIAQVALLLSQAKSAHVRYEVEELDGKADEDWPGWYAQYLNANSLPGLLGRGGAWEGLAEVLVKADRSHRANAPDERWEQYYARYLIG